MTKHKDCSSLIKEEKCKTRCLPTEILIMCIMYNKNNRESYQICTWFTERVTCFHRQLSLFCRTKTIFIGKSIYQKCLLRHDELKRSQKIIDKRYFFEDIYFSLCSRCLKSRVAENTRFMNDVWWSDILKTFL